MSEEKEKQGSMCLCLVCNCSGAECQVKSEIARLQTINAKLLEALEGMMEFYDLWEGSECECTDDRLCDLCAKHANAIDIIAKAKEEK